jgi:hypothetical protein
MPGNQHLSPSIAPKQYLLAVDLTVKMKRCDSKKSAFQMLTRAVDDRVGVTSKSSGYQGAPAKIRDCLPEKMAQTCFVEERERNELLNGMRVEACLLMRIQRE